MLRHLVIHIVLLLAFFLPGGLIWNRLDPEILGLPFSVFVTAVLLPLLIIANVVAYVRSFWADDKTVSSEVRKGYSVHEAEGTDTEAPPRNPRDERTN